MAMNKQQSSKKSANQYVKSASKPKKAKAVYTEADIDYDYERSVKFANRGCLVAILALFAVAAVVLLWGYLFINGEIGGKNATAAAAVTIDVPPGSGGTTIGGILMKNGLIGNEQVFRFYVRYNSSSGFQEGRYTIEPGASYEKIIEVLTQPPPPRETMNITFPEGSTVVQFARICEEKGLFSAADFIAAANDIEKHTDIKFLQHITFEPDTWMKAEGYLSPNTYNVFVDESPENIVRMLFEQFDKEIEGMSFETSEGELDFYEMLQRQGLSLKEAITLASIVEEEASNPDENQAKVAGVFYNRLKGEINTEELPRRTLGSDVTYYYVRDFIARDYGGNYDAVPQEFKFAYLALDEVGLREGLPVGPISNPAPHTIRAALQPITQNNFYFLTDFYGNYYYAENYAGHLRNIATMETQNAKYEEENGKKEEE